ncbi:MAG: hypothetical protein ABFQ95_03030 [Pseudomonadota bacterium]
MPKQRNSRLIEALKNMPLFLFALFSLNHGVNIFISSVASRENYFLHLIFYLLFAYMILFANFVMCRERIASQTSKQPSVQDIQLFKKIAYMTLVATLLVLVHIAFPMLMSLPDLTDPYAYFALGSCLVMGVLAFASITILKKHKLISTIYLRFYASFNLLALFLICLTTSKIFLW